MKEDAFDSWCIVELMGRQVIAGRVTEQTIGGTSFIRVDVPKCGDEPAFTRLLGPQAVFAMNPCDEQLALAAVKYYQPRPIDRYTLKEMMQRMLPGMPAPEPVKQDDEGSPCDQCVSQDCDGCPHNDNEVPM